MTGTCIDVDLRTAKRCYQAQVRNARRRGIPWEFTFEAWMKVWLESGKWALRGNGRNDPSKCYVMARNGDQGAYAPGNVRIATISENILEFRQGTPNHGRKTRVKNIGRGKGWTFRRNYKSKPYEVRCAGKYIGSFATQEQAEAAYQQASNFATSEISA